MNGVYIIFAKNQSRVKIGRSNNIARRFKELKTSFMDKADFCLLILTNNPNDVEKYLHRKFKKENIEELHGKEWFLLSSRLQNYLVNEIQQDVFLNQLDVQFVEESEWENILLTFTHKDIESSDFIRDANNVKRVIVNILLYIGIWYVFYDANNMLFAKSNLDWDNLNWDMKAFVTLKTYVTPSIVVIVAMLSLHIGSRKKLLRLYLWISVIVILYLLTKFLEYKG